MGKKQTGLSVKYQPPKYEALLTPFPLVASPLRPIEKIEFEIFAPKCERDPPAFLMLFQIWAIESLRVCVAHVLSADRWRIANRGRVGSRLLQNTGVRLILNAHWSNVSGRNIEIC